MASRFGYNKDMFENIRKKLFTPVASKEAVPANSRSYTISSFGSWAPTWDKGSVYDNSYASIKAIANAFVDIYPYAVNENGREVQSPVLDAINNPNDRMSGPVFKEALAVMTLTHRKAYILVWHKEDGTVKPGGVGATPENIAGFTFLESVTETIVNGVKSYYTTAYGTLSEQDVMEISVGVNPYNLSAGYSPAVAVKKWASVDDYIVAYEAGLFENNAVPDGQFTITAPNYDAFKDIVANMQAKHRGSGKNGNVQYVYKPIDPATGQVQSAQVEWQAFSQPNNSLALDKIFEQVNEKVDSAYGVPASIRGVSNNNNYASSAVDEAHFMKFTIKPFATKIWGAFTHELDRIVGGLGFVLTFDLDEVAMADEQKVVAETKKTEMDLLTAGLNAGYTAEQVINGFGLDIDFEALGEPKTIDEPSEPETTSEEAEKSVEVKKKIDSHCTCGHCHKKAELNREQRTVYSELKDVAGEQVQGQADQVIAELENQTEAGDFDYEELGASAETDDKQNIAFASGMMAVLAGYMVKTGKKTYKKGEKMLPAGTTGAVGYELSQETRRTYEDYLKNVAGAFNGDTTGRIKEILKLSAMEGWNKTELYNALKAVSGDSEEWRIERLAYNEERRAWNMADLDAMVTLQNQTGLKISKTWHTADSGACDYCKEMAGKTENVSDSFLSKNDVLELEDGSMFLNDFVDMEVAQLHPNCRCYCQYKVEGR